MGRGPGFSATLSLYSWKIISRIEWLLRGLHSGFWLGVLSRKQTQALDSHYHEKSKRFLSREYNFSGLFPWELQIIENHFSEGGTLALLGAGAGRETAALHKMGFRVLSFECNQELRNLADEILPGISPDLRILPMDPDVCPEFDEEPEAIILGWGVYSLIRGRDKRVALLKELRESGRSGSKLLLSFFLEAAPGWSTAIAAKLGRFLRFFLRGPQVEIGDWCTPRFNHVFSRESFREEVEAAGWKIVEFQVTSYPHAVLQSSKQEKNIS